MKRVFLLLVFLATVAAAAWSCCFQVPETHYAILTRFGRPREAIDEAGLYFKLPPPIDRVLRIDRRLQVLDPKLRVDQAEYLTAEKKPIIVHCFMTWSVRDPARFYERVQTVDLADKRLVGILRSQLGAVISSVPFSALVSTETDENRETTLRSVTAELTRRVAAQAGDAIGIDVHSVRIKRLNYPPANRGSTLNRMRTEREAVAKNTRSEGDAAAAEIRNEARRKRAELLATATLEAEKIRGGADATATRIWGEAFSADPEFFELTKALEAYAEVFGDDDVIMLPHDHPFLRVLQRGVADDDE